MGLAFAQFENITLCHLNWGASADFVSSFLPEFLPTLKSYILSYCCEIINMHPILYHPLTTFYEMSSQCHNIHGKCTPGMLYL